MRVDSPGAGIDIHTLGTLVDEIGASSCEFKSRMLSGTWIVRVCVRLRSCCHVSAESMCMCEVSVIVALRSGCVKEGFACTCPRDL